MLSPPAEAIPPAPSSRMIVSRIRSGRVEANSGAAAARVAPPTRPARVAPQPSLASAERSSGVSWKIRSWSTAGSSPTVSTIRPSRSDSAQIIDV